LLFVFLTLFICVWIGWGLLPAVVTVAVVVVLTLVAATLILSRRSR